MEHNGPHYNTIEVEGPHDPPKPRFTDNVIAAGGTNSPPVPSLNDADDKLFDTQPDRQRTDQVDQPSSPSGSKDMSNQKTLDSALNPDPGDHSLQITPLAPPSSTDASNKAMPPQHGFYNTIKMTLPRQNDSTLGSPGESSRNFKQYQLGDSTVVSGKGLGRGRPGIKRGPRTGSTHGADSGTSTPVSASISASATPVAASLMQGKRRRTASEGTKVKSEGSDSESDVSDSRDSTPEYNPTEETRSGRKIQKPTVAHYTVSESASPASKRPKLEGRTSAPAVSPAIKSHPKIKRRMYRGREQLALCEHCQRGHGPHGNAIVFCDACNKCWHQRCHDPHVPQSIVTDAKAEWFCASCEKILHGKKGKKSKTSEGAAGRAQPNQPQFVGPLIGGAALTQAHKIAFLESRTREQLISLILQGSDLAPALPMFQAPALQLPQARFKSNYTTPISSTPGLHPAATAADAEDEGYDSYLDDHAALYPKPGQGVKLPPDAVDLHILLEHPHSRTFSHWLRGMPTREYSGNADIVFQR